MYSNNVSMKHYFQTAIILKYKSNFWRTHQMAVINCEINLVLNWPKNCAI